MVRGVGLDRIIERPREEVNDWLLTRRDFLKMIGITALTLAGVGFAGCSSRGSGSVEFKPQNPLQSGYKLLVCFENAPEPPNNVILDIEEIGGKRGFEAYPPYELTCAIRVNGKFKYVPSTEITPNERIYSFGSNNIPDPLFGDLDAYYNHKTGAFSVKSQYFEELPKFFDSANKNMGAYSAIIIEGLAPDNNKACLLAVLIEKGGGKVMDIIFDQNPENPQEYKYYIIKSKEKLDKMMQTIFSELAENLSDEWITESGRKMLKEYAKDSKWRFFPEDYYRKKSLYVG